MSLDELTDEQSTIVLKTIDTFAKNRVYISRSPAEMQRTDYEIKGFLRATFKDPKDVALCMTIYDAKVEIYSRELARRK